MKSIKGWPEESREAAAMVPSLVGRRGNSEAGWDRVASGSP
jgi:hypothetical protein